MLGNTTSPLSVTVPSKPNPRHPPRRQRQRPGSTPDHIAMNPATHRSEVALFSLVSLRASVRLPSATESRCRRTTAPPNDRSAVFSSSYKLFLLSKKRSPSKSMDYKLQGGGHSPSSTAARLLRPGRFCGTRPPRPGRSCGKESYFPNPSLHNRPPACSQTPYLLTSPLLFLPRHCLMHPCPRSQ